MNAPTHQQLYVTYLLLLFRLTDSVTGVYFNYILSPDNASLTIQKNNLSTGMYVVNLVANGEIIDAKQLIIN